MHKYVNRPDGRMADDTDREVRKVKLHKRLTTEQLKQLINDVRDGKINDKQKPGSMGPSNS